MSETVSSSKRGRPAGSVAVWLTVEQVRQRLALVSVQTVYTWTRQRTASGGSVLPVRKFGRLVRIKESDLEKLPKRLADRVPGGVSFFERKEGKA